MLRSIGKAFDTATVLIGAICLAYGIANNQAALAVMGSTCLIFGALNLTGAFR